MKTYNLEMCNINGMEIVADFNSETTIMDTKAVDYLKDDFEGVLGFVCTKAEILEICDKEYSVKNSEFLSNEQIVFDNGGGITLQLAGWSHYYTSAEETAKEIVAWLETLDTTHWDGHEVEAYLLDPSLEEIANGGYRIVQVLHTIQEIIEELENTGWGNMENLAKELKALI